MKTIKDFIIKNKLLFITLFGGGGLFWFSTVLVDFFGVGSFGANLISWFWGAALVVGILFFTGIFARIKRLFKKDEKVPNQKK